MIIEKMLNFQMAAPRFVKWFTRNWLKQWYKIELQTGMKDAKRLAEHL